MDKRTRRRLEDERDSYEELPVSERRAVCFVLDIAKGDMDSEQAWAKIFDLSLVSAAASILNRMEEKRRHVVNAARYGDGELYKYVIDVSRFLLANDLIRSFEGSEFALVRLFGGEVRPFIGSVFAATLLHPGGGDPKGSFEHNLMKAVVCSIGAGVADEAGVPLLFARGPFVTGELGQAASITEIAAQRAISKSRRSKAGLFLLIFI